MRTVTDLLHQLLRDFQAFFLTKVREIVNNVNYTLTTHRMHPSI